MKALAGAAMGIPLAASPVSAARGIAPRSLVVPLAGFPPARHVEATTSASRLAKVFFEDPPREVPEDVKRLKREGFRLGAWEWFSRAHAEGEVGTEVFSSARGARAELASNVSFLRSLGFGVGEAAARFTVSGVPGSIGLSLLEPPARIDDVLFTSGRCVLVLGDRLEGIVSAEETRGPLIAGATALLARVKRPCRAARGR